MSQTITSFNTTHSPSTTSKPTSAAVLEPSEETVSFLELFARVYHG
jgi:hypothetical protein